MKTNRTAAEDLYLLALLFAEQLVFSLKGSLLYFTFACYTNCPLLEKPCKVS